MRGRTLEDFLIYRHSSRDKVIVELNCTCYQIESPINLYMDNISWFNMENHDHKTLTNFSLSNNAIDPKLARGAIRICKEVNDH